MVLLFSLKLILYGCGFHEVNHHNLGPFVTHHDVLILRIYLLALCFSVLPAIRWSHPKCGFLHNCFLQIHLVDVRYRLRQNTDEFLSFLAEITKKALLNWTSNSFGNLLHLFWIYTF